jgi:hypothetical protein
MGITKHSSAEKTPVEIVRGRARIRIQSTRRLAIEASSFVRKRSEIDNWIVIVDDASDPSEEHDRPEKVVLHSFVREIILSVAKAFVIRTSIVAGSTARNGQQCLIYRSGSLDSQIPAALSLS